MSKALTPLAEELVNLQLFVFELILNIMRGHFRILKCAIIKLMLTTSVQIQILTRSYSEVFKKKLAL